MSPCLEIGIVVAAFKDSGNIPCLNDKFIISDIIGEIKTLFSFRILMGRVPFGCLVSFKSLMYVLISEGVVVRCIGKLSCLF